jgi:beta-glucosidase
LDQVFGGGSNVVSGSSEKYEEYVYYKTDKTKETALAASNELVEQICDEGIILMKNDVSAGKGLPVATPVSDSAVSKKPTVSVFGKNSVNLVLGGSGSSSTDHSRAKTIYDSLSSAGYDYNPTLKSFYENNKLSGAGRDGEASIEAAANFGVITGETAQDKYTSSVTDSYASYNDLALIVISRTSGEGNDMPRTMRKSADESSDKVDGAYDKTDHYLELDKNEQDMIKAVCDYGFKNVVLVINSSTSMELGFLDNIDDNDQTSELGGYADKINAAVWIGYPGDNGIMSLGKVLNGSVDPSGRTVDLYARDFTKDPTFQNFGHNNTDGGNQYLVEGKREGRNDSGEYFVEYEESIYYGYRYYETRAYEEAKKGNEDWYENNVVYPFGYGLSYTTFDWDITAKTANNSVLSADGKISFEVEVTNTGSVAGKDVVEVYYSAPYTQGGIEKPYKVLAAYAKTGIIEAGKSETVTVEFDVRDMASYDCYDDNKNDFKGYELDGGEYKVFLAKNSHDVAANGEFSYTVPASGITYRENELGNEVVNQFDDVSSHFYSENQKHNLLLRSDFEGTFPATPTKAERTVSQTFLDRISAILNTNNTSDPWYVDESKMPAFDQAGDKTVKLYEMMDKDYDDESWTTFVQQLSASEIVDLIGTGCYSTMAITKIDKPSTIDTDGPLGFVNFMSWGNKTVENVCSYQSECVLAATWNNDLAYQMGIAVGDEALVGYPAGNNGFGQPYSGWYAPAVNIHRSPFGGRNFEYYSEEPLLSGKMAANVIQAANSKGVYTQLKHFAANDQETNRSGVCTWLDEQNFREIYLKPFEIAVKEGESHGVMSSFNRIGTTWTGGSYALLTNVLRGEWGFMGMVLTDFNTGPAYMNANQMLLAGGDINLATDVKPNITDMNASLATALQRAAKNILYVQAHSNAMNGHGEGMEWATSISGWKIMVIAVDVAVVALLAAWGVLALRRSKQVLENK